jgi:hypothetical protein
VGRKLSLDRAMSLRQARQNRNKYGGVSAQEARMGGGFTAGGGFRSGGGGGGDYGSNSSRYDDFDGPRWGHGSLQPHLAQTHDLLFRGESREASGKIIVCVSFMASC